MADFLDGKKTPQTFVITTNDKLVDLGIATDARLVYVQDKEKIYYDYNGERLALHDIIEVENEAEMKAIQTPVDNKIYLAFAEKTLWQYSSNTWFCLTRQPSVVFIGSDGFPSEGRENALYVNGTKIYKYDDTSKGYLEMSKSIPTQWGSF